MKLTGNTVLITGGGSGIGRGLAEHLHALGNKVIIAGRRKANLNEVTEANPGIESIELDIQDPASIAAVAKELIAKHPDLNVLVNNAGKMATDHADAVMDDDLVDSTIVTNLMGPIRMTSALIEQLKSQPEATVIHVTSGLAFTPLSLNATYCATKAALHSYAFAQRYKLKDTSVRVLEMVPPYVQTELTGEHQKTDPMAMPLKEYLEETMKLLATDADEILVERVKPQRNNPGPNEAAFLYQFNDRLVAARTK